MSYLCVSVKSNCDARLITLWKKTRIIFVEQIPLLKFVFFLANAYKTTHILGGVKIRLYVLDDVEGGFNPTLFCPCCLMRLLDEHGFSKKNKTGLAPSVFPPVGWWHFFWILPLSTILDEQIYPEKTHI